MHSWELDAGVDIIDYIDIGGFENENGGLLPTEADVMPYELFVRPVYYFDAYEISADEVSTIHAKLVRTGRVSISLFFESGETVPFSISASADVRGSVFRKDRRITSWLDFYGKTLTLTPYVPEGIHIKFYGINFGAKFHCLA